MENKNIFAQWDNADLEGIQKDIQEAAANGGGNFEEVPYGTYEVSIEKMELKATKVDKNSDDPKKHVARPMVSIWFNIVDGKYEGQKIFMNQVIYGENAGFQIHIVNELLRSMVQKCAKAPVVEFKSYSQYNDLLMDIHELVSESFEYKLKYDKTKKGFSTFAITEVFALED
jgi:hypothetical protein